MSQDKGTAWEGLLGEIVFVRAGDFQFVGKLVRVWGDRAGIDYGLLEDVLRIYLDAEKRPDPGEDRYVTRTRIPSTQIQEACTAVDQWGDDAWYHGDIAARRKERGLEAAVRAAVEKP